MDHSGAKAYLPHEHDNAGKLKPPPRKADEVEAWLRMLDLGLASGTIAPDRVAEFFPVCLGFHLNGLRPGFDGSNKPDDDIRITVNGNAVVDLKRNVGDYAALNFAHNAKLPFGARVEIDTFNGWQAGLHAPWRMTFNFGPYGQSTIHGGRVESYPALAPRDNPDPEYYDSPQFNDYQNNGSFLLPLPWPWAYPEGLLLDRSSRHVS